MDWPDSQISSGILISFLCLLFVLVCIAIWTIADIIYRHGWRDGCIYIIGCTWWGLCCRLPTYSPETNYSHSSYCPPNPPNPPNPLNPSNPSNPSNPPIYVERSDLDPEHLEAFQHALTLDGDIVDNGCQRREIPCECQVLEQPNGDSHLPEQPNCT